MPYGQIVGPTVCRNSVTAPAVVLRIRLPYNPPSRPVHRLTNNRVLIAPLVGGGELVVGIHVPRLAMVTATGVSPHPGRRLPVCVWVRDPLDGLGREDVRHE